MIKVLVLMGGTSEEREVSLRSGAGVYNALKRVGYSAKTLDVNAENLEKIKEYDPDVVFVALHGKGGEDGTIQGYLELLGVPYTGSGVAASANCMNKAISKKLFRVENIPTADYFIVTRYEYSRKQVDLDEITRQLGLPLVVKPTTQGSSIGVYIAKTREEVERYLLKAFTYDNEIVLEKFIEGPQLTVSVLGNDKPQILPIIEITSVNEFYDYESKYTPGMCEHIIPARISEEIARKVEKIAEDAYVKLNCRGFARVDFMVDKEGVPYVLEINTIPGMTEMSLVPDAARAAGISYEELCDKIVKLAING